MLSKVARKIVRRIVFAGVPFFFVFACSRCRNRLSRRNLPLKPARTSLCQHAGTKQFRMGSSASRTRNGTSTTTRSITSERRASALCKRSIHPRR